MKRGEAGWEKEGEIGRHKELERIKAKRRGRERNDFAFPHAPPSPPHTQANCHTQPAKTHTIHTHTETETERKRKREREREVQI